MATTARKWTTSGVFINFLQTKVFRPRVRGFGFSFILGEIGFIGSGLWPWTLCEFVLMMNGSNYSAFHVGLFGFTLGSFIAQPEINDDVNDDKDLIAKRKWYFLFKGFNHRNKTVKEVIEKL